LATAFLLLLYTWAVKSKKLINPKYYLTKHNFSLIAMLRLKFPDDSVRESTRARNNKADT
jgi:hypothetical protein